MTERRDSPGLVATFLGFTVVCLLNAAVLSVVVLVVTIVAALS